MIMFRGLANKWSVYMPCAHARMCAHTHTHTELGSVCVLFLLLIKFISCYGYHPCQADFAFVMHWNYTRS